MSQMISVIGKEGSGKTTIATNLATILSEQGYRTLLISAETRFGIIQRRLGVQIENKRSMYYGFLEEFKDKKIYKKVKDNLFITSLADDEDTFSYIELDSQIIKDSISEMKKDFDFIIADCTARPTDNLSYHFINESGKIISVAESSIDGMLFQNAHERLMKEADIFKNKTIINVLNKHDESLLNLRTIESVTRMKYNLVYKFNTSVIKDNISSEQSKVIQKVNEELLFSEIIKSEKERVQEKKGLTNLIRRLARA